MLIYSSYPVKIVEANIVFIPTINIYRKALAYLIDVVNKEWSYLSAFDGINEAENLVHSTKTNKAKYDFDSQFYKFPSYLRRSALKEAIGIVSSHYSRLETYISEKEKTESKGVKFNKKSPQLSLKHLACPALYKGNMFHFLDDETAEIKIYKNGDWVWFKVKLRKQDIKYLKKKGDINDSAPVLEKCGLHFRLRFLVKQKQVLPKKVPKKILSVDLGINNSAVCSVMLPDGTVVARKFINQAIEKDHLEKLLNRLKLKQQQGGRYATNKKLWSKINNLNDAIVHLTCKEIIEFAKLHNIDVINIIAT